MHSKHGIKDQVDCAGVEWNWYFGRPLRSAIELLEVSQIDGAAHDFFWDMPIWDFPKAVEDAGATQHGRDVSPLNNVEEEELVLLHCRGMRSIDPNKFKVNDHPPSLRTSLHCV